MKTTPNFKILIISWVLAVVFLVIGILTLGGATTLEVGITEYNHDAEYYETYDYKCEVEESGTYLLYVYGGRLESAEDEDGYSVSYSLESDYSDTTRIYSMYLSSYNSYEFEVEANSTYLTVKIEAKSYGY